MNDFRCSKCNALLGKVEGKAEILCKAKWKVNGRWKPCNTMNRFTTDYGGEQRHWQNGKHTESVGYMDWRKVTEGNRGTDKKCEYCEFYDEKSWYPSHGKCFHPKNNPNRKEEALKLVDGDNTCEHWEEKRDKKLLELIKNQY